MTIRPEHKLICVPPERIMDIWPAVAGMIDEGYAATNEPTPADLPCWLIQGKGQLWVSVFDGAIIAALTTSIVPRRHGLALRMVCCGGSHMSVWRDCHRQIEDFAKAEGCDHVTSDGREGWKRVLPGYKVTKVTLEKRL